MFTSALVEIHWEGDSRQLLSAFPKNVRADFGFALYELQQGKRPAMQTRRMESIGAGVYELKESDESGYYRVIYLTKIENRIHVLHSFKKTTGKTERRDLTIAAERLSRLRTRLQQERKHG